MNTSTEATATRTATATLAVDIYLRPVYPHAKSRVATATFRVESARFVVRHTTGHDGQILGATDHHGPWTTPEEARRFASSMGGRVLRAYDVPSPFDRSTQVIEVEPYWYHRNFGRVDACDLAEGEFIEIEQAD
jgi:hypothetical protein